MNENNKAKLYQKILAVQQTLEPLEKTGKNDFHRYTYSTASDVLLPVQRACNQQGLVIVADCIESQIEPGKASVTVRLTIADSETGENLSVTAPGYAEDWSWKDNKPTGDKALYKAITGATKYAVRSFFCLPAEDDPERTPTKSTASNGKLIAASQPGASLKAALIAQTTNEIRRLGWSTNQGQAYLQQNFGKSTRQSPSEPELQQFLAHLRSIQPSVLRQTVPISHN